ncbi:NAD-dependent protein deacetylase of SIR2 family [Pseudonocardia abyssalis]|uniref:NAD-dependent protein deacetylase of SIR2 family n=1 Tax=Pseudonocardia abyssalis TaxID=2792008 RepID=A0ABS6UZR9_9PSEU|nr:NAD-dependent protein deacetylase of SIR2 family [Pseudonocardia abyssalis]MBW0114525.1 NAD-dependent protein deacetylase of SIR2 family [Pseudonocardia abyssalis]MBW0137712.1 NAD-dependent protein deacetylase of SIR2 family [Pseudonocardia abyssalis]
MREIACDESGYEGARLVGGVTDVFAHAGVELTIDAAADCVADLRRRIRSPAQEYKANHLLRAKHRGTLLWLLGASGPVLGHAHVHLVDKSVFLGRGGTDLLVPALLEASRVWGDGITVVHDRQNALTPDRLAALPFPVRFVASGDDARVQVADFLAGVATRVASQARAGRPDPELAALLRPYLTPTSDPLLL